VSRFPKPVQPSEENPIEMLHWYFEYVQWAWKTVTAPSDTRTPSKSVVQHTSPLPRWLSMVEKIIWGLSGFILSFFITILMQMYGVDDPAIARFVLAFMSLWIFAMCIYIVFRHSKSSTIKGLGIVLPAIVLFIGSISVDNWFMTKRKERGRPATIEDLRHNFPWLTHEPQPQAQPQPSNSTTTAGGGKKPCAISPIAGTGFTGYKNVCDALIGQWAIDESVKLENLADAVQDSSHGNARLESWQLRTKLNECCIEDLKKLRADLVARLGPPLKDPNEISRWNQLFSEAAVRFDPVLLKEYTPYLRRLGVRLTRQTVPRRAPLNLQVTSQVEPPDSRQFPYKMVITISTTNALKSGYIVAHFDQTPAAINSETFKDAAMVDQKEVTDNAELSSLLASDYLVTWALRIRSVPVTSDKLIKLTVSSSTAIHLLRARWLDQ
jgi:hypothetical protein